jgi:hypothetical protein
MPSIQKGDLFISGENTYLATTDSFIRTIVLSEDMDAYSVGYDMHIAEERVHACCINGSRQGEIRSVLLNGPNRWPVQLIAGTSTEFLRAGSPPSASTG